MRSHKHLLLICLLAPLLSVPAFAQQEYSVFTATGRAGVATTLTTDYQCIGINPANLGFPRRYEEKRVTFGLLEKMRISAYTEALQKSEFRSSLYDYDGGSFTYEQKREAAKDFTQKPFLANIDIGIVGAAYHFDGDGGSIGFAIRERAQYFSSLSAQGAELLFEGYNNRYFEKVQLSDGTIRDNLESLTPYERSLIVRGFKNGPGQTFAEILNGSKISLNWNREYNLSYGRKIVGNDVMSLYGGVGVKYVQSFAVLHIEAKDNQLVEAYAATSPGLNIDYGDAAKSNPSHSDASNMQPVGTGVGLDFGLNASFGENEKIKVGFSVTNIGSINYDVNVYTVANDRVDTTNMAGFDSYNIPYEITQLNSDFGVVNYSGIEKKTQKLPTVVRLGGSYRISDKLEVGADVIVPTNEVPGSFNRPIFSAGGDYYIIPAIRLSTGISHGGNYDKTNIPVGVTFIAGTGTYEVGIASRDAITFFAENGPSISVAFGFLRFRI